MALNGRVCGEGTTVSILRLAGGNVNFHSVMVGIGYVEEVRQRKRRRTQHSAWQSDGRHMRFLFNFYRPDYKWELVPPQLPSVVFPFSHCFRRADCRIRDRISCTAAFIASPIYAVWSDTRISHQHNRSNDNSYTSRGLLSLALQHQIPS